MIGKLFDSERRVMECLWDEGELSAKEIAERLNKKVGWSKTTTYTISGLACRIPAGKQTAVTG